MEKYGTLLLSSSEETIAVLGDEMVGPQTAEQKGREASSHNRHGRKRSESPKVGGVTIGSRNTLLRLERNPWSMAKMT